MQQTSNIIAQAPILDPTVVSIGGIPLPTAGPPVTTTTMAASVDPTTNIPDAGVMPVDQPQAALPLHLQGGEVCYWGILYSHYSTWARH